jgi:hypothetical protein
VKGEGQRRANKVVSSDWLVDTGVGPRLQVKEHRSLCAG